MFTTSQLEPLFKLSPPVLTAYVCTGPVETSLQGPAAWVALLKDEGRSLADGLPPAEQKLFSPELERVEKFLGQRAPREKSLVIFAGAGVWQVVPLQVQVRNELAWGKPALAQLLALASEHKAYGIVAIDHAGVRFFHYRLGEIVEAEAKKLSIDVSQWKRKDLGHVTGQGVAKRRGSLRDAFRDRLENRYALLSRPIAQQAARFCERKRLAALFLVGPTKLIRLMDARFPVNSRPPRVLFSEELARVAPTELLKHVEPVIAEWERRREADLVAAVTSDESAAVVGLDETLAQLQKGRIRTLVLAEDLNPCLRECVKCGWKDRSADPVCPVCGGQRRDVPLRSVLPELVRKEQADLEMTSDAAAERLNRAGGAAGWLRQPKAAAAATRG